MFKEVKKQLEQKFQMMLASAEHLFYVAIDREVIWDAYLHGFPVDEQQEYNCNCCKSFLRQYAGIVAIIDGKRVSIWDDLEVPEHYKNSIDRVKNYVAGLPITDVFFNDFPKMGTNENFDAVREVTWSHFSLLLPTKFVKRKDKIDSLKGELRTNKELLKRALTELTIDSVETVLDLINQNSLYRGKESEKVLQVFLKLQKEYEKIVNNPHYSNEETHNFCWIKSLELGIGICGIRNTAIGTLLINLSEGMDLDTAVAKFEQVVAPANYKRPTALVTPKMIASAKEKLEELGLMDSLERRFANETDLSVEDIIYTDKSTSMSDVFGDMAKETLVNPKTLSKVEEVSIKDFIEKVVPTSKSIEVLVENSHLNNFVSLITGVIKGAKSLFKWNNLFSWSYTGGITDSIKERVKAAGGKVDGVLRFSIQWNDEDTPGIVDLDAHAFEPDGTHINFSNYKGRDFTSMSGNLDVDMIDPSGPGVENITWTNQSQMKDGVYQLKVHNYNGGRNKGFKAQVEFNGEIYDFMSNTHLSGTITVAHVHLNKGVFTIQPHLESNSTILSKDKWKVKTNQFTKVKKIMLSPNHWNGAVGNKHYMFLLENCISDETARPFFNEFLSNNFDENRKVFEIMGGKMKVEHTDNQLSGIGFSETQRNHLFVRVDGNFKRVLKVNF